MKLVLANGKQTLDLEVSVGEEYVVQQVFEQLGYTGFLRLDMSGRMSGHQNQYRPDASGRMSGHFLPQLGYRPDAEIYDVHPQTVIGPSIVGVPAMIGTEPPSGFSGIAAQLPGTTAAIGTESNSSIKWGFIAALVGASIGLSTLAWHRMSAPPPAKVAPSIGQVGKFSDRPLPVPTPPPLPQKK
jgi:hypothetical protein